MEFCVMLPETDYESAQATARRIHEALTEAIKGNGWPVTVSLGAVTFTAMDAGMDEMLRMADELMYAVKKSGKNQIKLIARP
jgi:diguanylate cyclase (GGDEF)-like protein